MTDVACVVSVDSVEEVDFLESSETLDSRVELWREDAGEVGGGVLGDVDANGLAGDGLVRRGGTKALCQTELG